MQLEIRDKISRQLVKLEVNQTLMDTALTRADHYEAPPSPIVGHIDKTVDKIGIHTSTEITSH